MVIIGSILGIENSQDFGCIIGAHLFSISNLIFLIISSILLYKALKSKNPRTVLLLVSIESGIWIIKYFLYKGGYVTGFGGTANPLNVMYDFTAIGIRIFLLLILATQTKQKLLIASVSSLIIVVIKINLFAMPWFTQKKWELEDNKSSRQRTEIIGNYSGNIVRLSDNKIEPLNLTIDSTHLRIQKNPPFAFEKDYFFGIDYPNRGIIATKGGIEYDMKIDRFEEDSLVFYLEDMLIKEYFVKLKTERIK